MKTIVNTLAAAAEAEAEAEARAQAEEQHRQAEEQRQQQEPMQEAPAQAPRAPRTLLLPQDMPMDERPHCEYIGLVVGPHNAKEKHF